MVDSDSQWTKKGVPEPFLQLHSKSDKEDVATGCDSHLLYLPWEGELQATRGPWSSEVGLVWLCKIKADSWSKGFY